MIGGGVVLLVAGVLFALLELGVLLIADCGPACQARGEQVLVVLLIAAGLAAAVLGAWLVRRGVLTMRGARRA